MFYELTAPQFAKMLNNLDAWLGKAVDHAEKKKFDPNVLVAARLAPDQYALARQVQSACDSAKFACARLAGKAPPSHPDTEVTVDELRARIRAVIEYLGTFTAQDFEGASSRAITLPFAPGKSLDATAYVLEMAIPNFFFHLITAYAILRHNGVDVGKSDFIGSLPFRDA